jgi:NAD(P)-dependent dehydrogenase (short-subunit alcohol dehydrogenase family)
MTQLNNPFSLRGKNFLVTGAASGVGKATSLILSNLGANLILVDINKEGLCETRKECRQTDVALTIDLSDASAIREKIMTGVKDFGKLNGLVHIAGIPYIAPLKAVSSTRCDEVYKLNTYAAIELAKIFTDRHVYAGEKGSLVFISSVYALVGSSANVCYAMSKAALHGITKALSIELAPRGIRVNCVAPGFIKTKMLNQSEGLFNEGHQEQLAGLHPLGLGEPEDVGFAVAYLLSDAAKWVTGSILSVDGGFTSQ